MRLLGREREEAALDRLVESARDGYGGALVVHGEPGVGKTALLDDAVDKATSLRIVRSSGVEGDRTAAALRAANQVAVLVQVTAQHDRPVAAQQF